MKRALQALAIAVALAWAITQLAAIYYESVNWDELALFNRTEYSRLHGRIDGGGRPGLTVVALLPFVAGCTDTMSTITSARLLWAGATLALLAGLFMFLLRAVREGPWRWHAAALGTASLALVPVFLRWTIQVRTDQPAIAAAMWGGVLALASRARPRLALGAGTLFGLGYLFSQKAVYVLALVIVVALGDLFRDATLDWRRELKRIAFAVVGLVAMIAAYHVLVAVFSKPPENTSAAGVMDVFANYRKLFGLRLYRSMVSSLYPQIVLGALLLAATFYSERHAREHRRTNLTALAVAVLGMFVGWFHAAAFPYFWSSLGLFPATVIAIGWPGIAAMLRRAALPVLLVLAAWLLWIAIPYRRELFLDPQAIQRQSYTFIEHVLPPHLRGFNADGGLFCRHDPDLIPQYFREAAEALGQGPDADKRQDDLIGEFRRRPIAYILDTFLLDPFPQKVRDFWAHHYVRYAGTVSVAGQTLRGPAGSHGSIDILVPGDYRWYGATPIHVADALVAPGATITLRPGPVAIELDRDTAPAAFCLALPGVPARDRRAAFHSMVQIVEIIGGRTDW